MAKRRPRESRQQESAAAAAPAGWLREPATIALLLMLAVVSLHLGDKLIGGGMGRAIGLGLALVAIPFRAALFSPWLWGAAMLLLGWCALGNAAAANHTYLLTYTALALTLPLRLPTREEAMDAAATSVRWLLVAVMTFAVVQKGLSADFRDGSYLSYLTLTGGVGQLAWEAGVAPETRRVLEENVRRDRQFTPTSRTFERDQVALLNPFGKWLPLFVATFAVGILVAEAVLAVGFAWRPNAVWPHALLQAFGASLLLIRPETVFIATLTAAGALSARRADRRVLYGYVALGCVAIVLTLAGMTSRLDGG
ncbi:hypothetical protein [Lacipirellula sp.]|uniref:hypothetical protein n=1 Tax=Lacipirellula sp. TaxID=2691419 RepID=UPI003D0B961F